MAVVNCTCQRHFVSPRCPEHGIGWRYLANLAGLVAAFTLAVIAIFTAPAQSKPSAVQQTICKVFGPYCGQALRVSWCESRWNTRARNGQYVGLFQMGSWERRQYGHGRTALAQSVAARRYFRASGRDWSPWSCRWAA